MPRNPKKKRCKAKNRKGKQCRNWAKADFDVCHYHGAGGGAPKNNKNAVTTGEHEAIYLDALREDERVLFSAVKTDTLEQIDNEIRLLEIRERRMLQRISNVMDGWEEENIQTKYERIETPQKVPVFGEDGKMTHDVVLNERMVETERTEKRRSKLERILNIEEALTRVQDKKAKLIDMKHRILAGQDPGDKESIEIIIDYGDDHGHS